MKNVWLGITSLALFVGCGSPPPVKNPLEKSTVQEKPKVEPKVAETQKPPAEDAESKRLIAEMLDKVARVRGLPIKHPVPGEVIDRDALGKRIRDMVTEETPKEALLAQGELLAALELVPPDYDFIQGALALLGGRVAGYYDPRKGTMVLAGDLSEAEADETLAHELAHALADQSFPLTPHVEYQPGQSDRSSAAHAFIEGDATSTMLDVMVGSAFELNEEAVRLSFVASTLMSEIGSKTPKSINSSLVAPYVDGFACIQALRRRGDWRAVDEVWRNLPETTEQLLHIDKLLAREPAEIVAKPSLGPLEKDGYKIIDHDVMGEQGLRILLEEVASRSLAREGAAGWGGDQAIVAQREVQGKRQFVAAYRLRMDTVPDAGEVAALFEKKYGAKCRERKELGPVAWEIKGRDLLLVSGPYERRESGPVAMGTCALSKQWLSDAWTADPPAPVPAKQRANP